MPDLTFSQAMSETTVLITSEGVGEAAASSAKHVIYVVPKKVKEIFNE